MHDGFVVHFTALNVEKSYRGTKTEKRGCKSPRGLPPFYGHHADCAKGPIVRRM